MQRFNLAALVSALMLSSISLAQAQGPDKLNLNFMSKRPYQASPENKASANAKWQGASDRVQAESHQEGAMSNNTRQQQQLKIQQLGKRNYL